ncbi:MAG TPA: hypothetical protein DDW90_11650 [Cyanobacteria bacterium UBA9971]|nr:hypothetical protein [Cyanobacteria bacterium UBA9971]
MTKDWQLQEQELKNNEKLLIEINRIIRENEKERSLISKIKLMLLNSKKEKIKLKIKDLKQKEYII